MSLKAVDITKTDEVYYCIYCMRAIYPEKRPDGLLYIHDEVPHPDNFIQQDDEVQH